MKRPVVVVALAAAVALATLLIWRPWRSADDGPHQGPSATVDERYYGDGPRVVVLGDSITNSVHDRLHAELADRSARIASVSGEAFVGGPATYAAGRPTPFMVERAAALARTDPAVAVVALGTNDALQPAFARRDSTGELDRVFRSFDRACTVGVLIAPAAPGSPAYDEEKAAVLNQRIRARSDVVVDWRLHPRPGDLRPDDIHLTDQGQRAYARAVAAGVRACG